jgi:hypothetical protein
MCRLASLVCGVLHFRGTVKAIYIIESVYPSDDHLGCDGNELVVYCNKLTLDLGESSVVKILVIGCIVVGLFREDTPMVEDGLWQKVLRSIMSQSGNMACGA